MRHSGDVVRRRLVVTGRVQGVGYRAGVARQAVAAGVSGFARNRYDGSVLVELEGTPAAVAGVETWCRTGPRFAEVIDVVADDVEPAGSTWFDVG